MKHNLDRAILMAVTAHHGQLDKAGEPYILHPLRVMLQMDSHPEKIVAVLHDVVEDTDTSLLDIKKSFGNEIYQAVKALTRGAIGYETYEEYIQRVKKNPLAVKVKLIDIVDNLSRRKSLTKKLEKRYHAARAELLPEFLGLVHIQVKTPSVGKIA